jgi:glycosyltransferase involved in cell wall biosynthesis
MDGVPVVLMEAMALGVPCVSTRISGIPELVEHGVTGLLTPPGDARALASAIGRLLDEEGLAASVAGAARRKVEAEYDSEANAGRLLSLMRGRESEIA